MPRSRNEHHAQSALFRMAELHYDRFPELKRLMFAVPNGGNRDARTGAILKREGVKRGIYDVLILVPRGHYHGFLIEMKYGNGKLTEEQAAFRFDAIANGYCVLEFWDWEKAWSAIVLYLTQP